MQSHWYDNKETECNDNDMTVRRESAVTMVWQLGKSAVTSKTMRRQEFSDTGMTMWRQSAVTNMAMRR